MTSPTHELRDSLALLRPFWGRCLLYAWIGGLLPLASTVYMFEVYDRVVNSRSITTLLMLTLWILGVYAVMEILEWSRRETLRAMGRQWDEHMTPRLHDLSLRSRLRRDTAPPGQALADFRTLRDGLMNPVVGALMEAPVALVFLVVIFAVHPLLGWVSLVVACVQVGLTAWNERSSGAPLREANRASGSAQACATEVLRQTEVTEAMGLQRDLQRRWWEWQSRLLAMQALASERAGRLQAATKFLQTLIGSMLLGLAAYLMLHNDLPGGGGMMIVASVLGGRVLAPLVAAVTQWRAGAQILDAWQRLSAVLQATPPPAAGMPLPPPRGDLSVEQLGVVAPGSSSWVLRGLNWRLPPGQVLAVIGPSGAGKTSLARALVGVWSCAEGTVRLDGADVHAWDKAELGPHLGYLPQEVGLLEGTLAENISRFSDPDGARLQDAIEGAGLASWVASLPQGAETPLGLEGLRLSAGQRQRVGLARALYGSPVLVVLDEPDAHLDDTGEQQLLQVLARLKSRAASAVVITHRTRLVSAADAILILRDGKQQAYGPRDKILAALQQAAAQASAQAGDRS